MTYYHGNYDDGCPDCGTTDTVHDDGCSYASTPPEVESKTVRAVGDPCDVCEGPCNYGKCPDCGGHSEHNWGCPQTATASWR